MTDAAERLQHIRREVQHAKGTTWPSGDSWIRGYAEDCEWLLVALRQAEADRDEKNRWGIYEQNLRRKVEAERVRLETALREAREFLEAARPFFGIALSGPTPSMGWRCDKLYANLGAVLAASGSTGDCTNCDGIGHNTTWPHTTCPVCGGSGSTGEADE